MLSPTEGHLSPCPSCFSLSLSLGSLALPPGKKESLGQITPLHVVTFGAYISNKKCYQEGKKPLNLGITEVLEFCNASAFELHLPKAKYPKKWLKQDGGLFFSLS
jgi:hypothetical protein